MGPTTTPRPALPRPGGQAQDRRPDLKQVQTGLAVSGDGGVPVWHRAYDGGAGEVAQVVEAMTRLKELAGQRGLLLVGDAKLISRGNILAMNQARVGFIAPAAKSYLPAAQLRVLDLAAATPVDYQAERDQPRRPSGGAATGSWKPASPWPASARPTPTSPSAACCLVLGAGPGRCRQPGQKLDRAHQDLQRVQRGLGGPHYRTPAKVTERVPASPPPASQRLPSRRGRHRPNQRQAHPVVDLRPGRPGR